MLLELGLLCHSRQVWTLLNLLFLRYLLACFVVAEWKFLSLLGFLRNLRAPRGPSLPFFFIQKKSKFLLNLLFFLFLWYILLAFFDVVVIAIQILVTFPIFAKFVEFFRAFFTFSFISLNFCLLCNSCYYYDIYQGGFFFLLLQWKFFLLYAIFEDFFRFLRAISIKQVFAEIGTKIF